MLCGTIGDITWHRIIESEGPEFEIGFLLPDASPKEIKAHRHWMEPHFLEPGTNRLIMTTQSYLLRTPTYTILVDSCVGNHKERRFYPPWSGMSGNRYLKNLSSIGVSAEEIDFVMCTHLHADHVGWNTQLINGRWVPTFPNAQYIFAETEFNYWSEINKKGKKYSDGCIDDSVLPVVEAGQAEIVSDTYNFNNQIWFEPTPGHTPGHVSLKIKSNGENGVISGDIVHTPIQCREPNWSAVGCSDRAQSASTRKTFLDQYCDTDTLVLTSHFPSPSVGYVVGHGKAFDFDFLE